MSKFISTDWKVSVDGTDLSQHAFSVDAPQAKEQVDVSGFNPTGSREFLQGLEDQTITIQFLQDFGSNSVHDTLGTLYDSGSLFIVYVQPDSDAGTSDTNPWFGGTAQLYTYDGFAATLNQRGEVTAEFKPAPGNRFHQGTAGTVT